MTDGDWGVLMVATQRGETAPYRRLLALLRLWLMEYFRRRLPPAIVEDAVRETLIAIHSKRHTFDPRRPFGPWMAAIARYKWIDRIRAMKQDNFQELDEKTPVADHHSAVIGATVLDELLAALNPAQRRVIRLVKIEGFSVREAAALSGQSVSLVKVNIHRGMSRMAALAAREGRLEPLAS